MFEALSLLFTDVKFGFNEASIRLVGRAPPRY